MLCTVENAALHLFMLNNLSDIHSSENKIIYAIAIMHSKHHTYNKMNVQNYFLCFSFFVSPQSLIGLLYQPNNFMEGTTKTLTSTNIERSLSYTPFVASIH